MDIDKKQLLAEVDKAIFFILQGRTQEKSEFQGTIQKKYVALDLDGLRRFRAELKNEIALDEGESGGFAYAYFAPKERG